MLTSTILKKEPELMTLTKEMYQDFYIISRIYNIPINQLIKELVDEDVKLIIE